MTIDGLDGGFRDIGIKKHTSTDVAVCRHNHGATGCRGTFPQQTDEQIIMIITSNWDLYQWT
jgi:hypothetical protein